MPSHVPTLSGWVVERMAAPVEKKRAAPIPAINLRISTSRKLLLVLMNPLRTLSIIPNLLSLRCQGN